MPFTLTRRRIETLIAALVAIGAAVVGLATREQTTLGAKYVALDRIATLKNPAFLTQPPGPGSDLYVAQKGGAIRIISGDRLLRRPFLDIRNRVEAHGVRGEPGMTSIAFPPDYRRRGVFYIAYTDHRDALVVASYRRSAGVPRLADPRSGRTVLTIPEPTPGHPCRRAGCSPAPAQPAADAARMMGYLRNPTDPGSGALHRLTRIPTADG